MGISLWKYGKVILQGLGISKQSNALGRRGNCNNFSEKNLRINFTQDIFENFASVLYETVEGQIPALTDIEVYSKSPPAPLLKFNKFPFSSSYWFSFLYVRNGLNHEMEMDYVLYGSTEQK